MPNPRGPITSGLHPQTPPIQPSNPSGTTPRDAVELELHNGNTITRLRVVRDQNNVPMFTEGTAPALTDSLNTATGPGNVDYSTTPPTQGKTNVVVDFSKGLAYSPLYEKGKYAFGERVWSIDTGGLILRAPELFDIPKGSGETGLASGERIKTFTTHNSQPWFATELGNVYYITEEMGALVYKAADAQPSPTSAATQLYDWQGILLLARDTAAPYVWSNDDGATWHEAVGGPIFSDNIANRGTGYVVGDVLTVAGGSGDATVTVDQVDIDHILSTTLTNGGTGYVVGNAIPLVGGTGFGATLYIDTVVAGVITVAHIGASGYGYTATDTLTPTGGNNDAVITVDTVGGGDGGILSATLTFAGTNYSATPETDLLGGSGTDATLQITAAEGQAYAKFWTDYRLSPQGENPSRPVLLMSSDPNLLFYTEDPTRSLSWSSGSLVGGGGHFNNDHNTSLTVAPTGELLVGKAQRLYDLLATTGNVNLKYGPIPVARADIAMENFAWPARIGQQLFYVINDSDIGMYRLNDIVKGYGPAARTPGTPETQKAIVALASDTVNLLFAALAGEEGYVMAGVMDNPNNPQWHGAVAKAEYVIGMMWVDSFPNTSDVFRDNYLFVAEDNDSDVPKLSGMRIPRGNLFYDTDATFSETASVRFGKDYAGQTQVTKVFSRATPNTYNLDNPDPTAQLLYRTAATGFSSLATFDQSPIPSNLIDTYAVAGVSGTHLELQAILTGDTATPAALESIEYVVFRRPIRKDYITCSVYADNAGMTREGGRRNTSWTQLMAELRAARDAVTPPLLIDKESGLQWTVDLQGWTRRWLKDNDGTGATMVIDLTMIELDTSTAPANFVTEEPNTDLHAHQLDSFTGNGILQNFTLSYTPLDVEVVYIGATYQIPTANFTVSGNVIHFIAAPANLSVIHVAYSYAVP